MATHGLDRQHKELDRTPCGRVSQNDRGWKFCHAQQSVVLSRVNGFPEVSYEITKLKLFMAELQLVCKRCITGNVRYRSVQAITAVATVVKLAASATTACL